MHENHWMNIRCVWNLSSSKHKTVNCLSWEHYCFKNEIVTLNSIVRCMEYTLIMVYFCYSHPQLLIWLTTQESLIKLIKYWVNNRVFSKKHDCLVFECLLPQRIDLALIIEQRPEKRHLTQSGYDEDYHVKCWQEVDTLEIMFSNTSILEISYTNLILQMACFDNIVLDLLQLGL